MKDFIETPHPINEKLFRISLYELWIQYIWDEVNNAEFLEISATGYQRWKIPCLGLSRCHSVIRCHSFF